MDSIQVSRLTAGKKPIQKVAEKGKKRPFSFQH